MKSGFLVVMLTIGSTSSFCQHPLVERWNAEEVLEHIHHEVNTLTTGRRGPFIIYGETDTFTIVAHSDTAIVLLQTYFDGWAKETKYRKKTFRFNSLRELTEYSFELGAQNSKTDSPRASAGFTSSFRKKLDATAFQETIVFHHWQYVVRNFGNPRTDKYELIDTFVYKPLIVAKPEKPYYHLPIYFKSTSPMPLPFPEKRRMPD